ncbi:hypothetical protein F4820DRAFT_450061 [Hypoxylon rubiginosum]|uniref:Uncharacterized protein n=1 Tax=Hypoxylon rubiginosum TaxID=110542 RepID=A0ACB9YW37_9PEZI|nr:hypothetical protein F4820DRAFT_450061 [Hypoxylon rubiginosum]
MDDTRPHPRHRQHPRDWLQPRDMPPYRRDLDSSALLGVSIMIPAVLFILFFALMYLVFQRRTVEASVRASSRPARDFPSTPNTLNFPDQSGHELEVINE